MASILKVGTRWRALVRRAGHSHCKTFGTRAQAHSWAATIEQEVDQLISTGYLQTKSLTFGDIVDRYEREVYPLKPWGRSKSADLRLLKTEFGTEPVSNLNHERLMKAFTSMHKNGAGGVTISARAGYLVTVLSTAKDVWRLNVPLEAAKGARSALSTLGLIKKSKHRDRRVTDLEIQSVVDHLSKKSSVVPMADVLWFCVASAMRISEVCRLQWDDLDEADKTIRIRDRKHPSVKMGNHQIVPLLTVASHDAFALAMKQPRRAKRVFPVNHRTVGTYFQTAVSELEIDDLHLHDLRHEAISRLFEAGYRIEEVSLVSGHRDWSMLKRYTHLRAVDLHRSKVA